MASWSVLFLALAVISGLLVSADISSTANFLGSYVFYTTALMCIGSLIIGWSQRDKSLLYLFNFFKKLLRP